MQKISGFIVLGLIATVQLAQAEEAWPTRPIRFIVAAAPGSAGDAACRVLAQKLGERLGQQFVMDNRPAAGGTIAVEAIARAAPDGYTVGLVSTSTLVIAPLFNAKLGYDPAKDFAPISLIGSSPYVLAVYPGLPAGDVGALVALAKAKPGQLNNASFGTTSLGYLAGVLFAHRAGIEVNQVSYRSSAQAVLDTISGRIDMQFSTLAPAVPLIRQGQLRALGVTGRARIALLPEVPTLAEAGLPGFDVAVWFGVAAPAGTPQAIVSKLNREMTDLLEFAGHPRRAPDARHGRRAGSALGFAYAGDRRSAEMARHGRAAWNQARIAPSTFSAWRLIKSFSEERERPMSTKVRNLLRALVVCGGVITAVVTADAARAADYPNRPIKVVVPFGAAGVTDIVARVVFDRISNAVGQSVVIDNRPGAGGTIAVEQVVNSPPDGYTLVMVDPRDHCRPTSLSIPRSNMIRSATSRRSRSWAIPARCF